MDALQRYDRDVRIVHRAATGGNAATALATGVALIQGGSLMRHGAGMLAITAGAATLAMPDQFEVSKSAGLAQIVGGITLMTATSPLLRSRAGVVIATGAMIALIDHGTADNAGSWNRSLLKGVVAGGGIGLTAGIGRGFATGLACAVAGGVVGGVVGKGMDELRHRDISLSVVRGIAKGAF